MKLFTQTQYELLLKNGSDENQDKDHPPVVKLFITNTNCTWLLSEINPGHPDIAFGLCDLGMGFPELGYVSLNEIRSVVDVRKLRFLERDNFFTPKYPMSVYSKAARMAEHIVTDDMSLTQAALKYQP